MTRASRADVQAWLRRETPEHLELMSKLRGRLSDTIETDVTEKGVPTREWCRALARYQSSFGLLLTEERERIKLRIMLGKTGDGVLTDEEYEQEMKSLAVESLGTLPLDALHSELEKRGALAPPLNEKDDVEDD